MGKAVKIEKTPLITVYTCVYNMADKIHRAIESMKNQRYRNIEHIIIDDGSTDRRIKSIIDEYIKSVEYAVIYIRKENGGKHTATNIAFEKAHGEYLVQLDADDELLPDALHYFMQLWAHVNAREDANKYWCVSCAVRTQHSDSIFGNPYPINVNQMEGEERTASIKKVHGEKIGCMRGDVLKKYRFPEPECVKFVPESVVWNEIERHYITWYDNEIVRIYYIDEGESLSRPKRSKQFYSNVNWAYRYNESLGEKWTTIVCVKYLASYFMATAEFRQFYPLIDPNFNSMNKYACYLGYAPVKFMAILYDAIKSN